MDAARRAICSEDIFNPLLITCLQGCGMLVFAQFFHIVLKPLGQPGPIAQILAGLVLGPSLLCRIRQIKEFMLSYTDYTIVIAFIFRILFMFLIGLEADIQFLRRNWRQACVVAYAGLTVCFTFGAAISYFVIHMLKIHEHKFAFANIVMIILASSASPIVVRLTAELKLDSSDVGRLAISCSLINELSCVLWYAAYLACTSRKMFGVGVLCLFLTAVVIGLNWFSAFWFNKRNQNRKYLHDSYVLMILCEIILVSFFVEKVGYNSTISCFIVGLMFPREGKTTRTLLRKLTYMVNYVIIPIYFGFYGLKFDVKYLTSVRNCMFVALVILLSIGGKIVGVLAACHHLKIPRNEGVILAFLLNLKGNTELLLIEVVPKSLKWWDDRVHNLVIIVVILSTLVSGPAVSLMLRREEKYFAQSRTSLEFHDPDDSELRMLLCVHDSRSILTKVGLISALSGSQRAPVTTYLTHLIELPKKQSKKKLMYHELQDGEQFSDDDDYGGNDELEINEAIDGFSIDNKVTIKQRNIVSSFASMYEDVCNAAEDLRVSIIFLTFNKHQRLDGKLETDKEGFTITNQKVLRHAPCSVGIFVDRPHTGFQQPSSESVQNVAAFFFGGPDDREALACGKRIASHPHIQLSVVRFLDTTSMEQCDVSNRNEEVVMTISNSEVETAVDNVFLEDFYNRYVASGQVGYVEKYVSSGAETVEVLREIGEMYSLFIVGKGGRGLSPLTNGLSEWEECPELGTLGDLLASSELKVGGSVLVIQQHRHSRNNLMDD